MGYSSTGIRFMLLIANGWCPVLAKEDLAVVGDVGEVAVVCLELYASCSI
jgi:hypothetical protein